MDLEGRISDTLWRGRALPRLAGCTLRRLAARPIKRLVVCPSSHRRRP